MLLTITNSLEPVKDNGKRKASVENQAFNKRKAVCRVATFASLLCSCFGISLHTAKSFCFDCIFQIQIIDTACDYVQGMLVAAVVLGILAVILSKEKQVTKSLGEFTPNDLPSDSNGSSNKTHRRNTRLKVLTKDRSFQHEKETKSKKYNSNVHSPFESTSTKCIPLQNTPCLDKLTRKSAISSCSGPVAPYVKRSAVETQKQTGVVPFQSMNLMLPDHVPQDPSRTFCMKSSNVIGNNNEIVQFIATRKVTYFPDGPIHGQEELKVKKITTFYRSMETTEIRKSFNSFHGTPQNDHVSEVATKMEALQFFH